MKDKNTEAKRELYDYDSEKDNHEKKKSKNKAKHAKEEPKKNNKKVKDDNKVKETKERKKTSTKKNKKTNIKNELSENKISDNEIIIGVTQYTDENKSNKKKIKKIDTTKNKSDKIKNRNEKVKLPKENKKKQKDNKEQITKRKSKFTKLIKWTSSVILIIGLVAFAMLSPTFNVKEVIVTGNELVRGEKIITLAEIELEENIFRINKKEIEEKIKTNGYVKSVTIKRKLPNKIELQIEERKVDFIIEYGNGYAYINNQGYILEINSTKKTVPILIGTVTPKEQLVEANRLISEDLKKMENVLKIMSVSQVNEIDTLITSIDISDSNDYIVYFDGENKKAYLGDCSDIETRILFLTAILKSEEGKPGEIFVNMNLNKEDAFFRQSV